MSIVDIRRQTPGIDLGAPLPGARVEELLRMQEPADVQAFVLQQPPLAIMSYAEATLQRAYELSPLNKDHYANMGRMYSFWYNRLQQDPALLQQAVDWYRRGTETAPQDVTILNEYASAIAIQANEARKQGDEATALARFAEAGRLLEKSRQIDPRYGDTDVRLAEVLRLVGRYAEAVDQYVALLTQNPRALDNQIATIIEMLRGQPELLLKLRAAYEAAVATNPDDYASHALIGLIAARGGDLPRAAAAFVEVIRIQPQNLEARQNYTLVLSDMMQYQQASAQAEELLRLAAQQNLSAQDRSALEALLAFMQAKAQGR
jgi:tetratricopeptide (TPR) repeat protein